MTSKHVRVNSGMNAGTDPDKDVYVKMVCSYCGAVSMDSFKQLSESKRRRQFKQGFHGEHAHGNS